jgi:branched-chain amino acid aminotransferase
VLALCAERGVAVQVGDWSLTDVYTADEVFVTGTMGGLTPVVRVDGRGIGTGGPGPVTRSLAAAYAELTARSGTPVVDESS